MQQLEAQNLLSDEEDDEDDDIMDAEFKRIREKRMAELKASHKEKMENLSKGHGQYRCVPLFACTLLYLDKKTLTENNVNDTGRLLKTNSSPKLPTAGKSSVFSITRSLCGVK